MTEDNLYYRRGGVSTGFLSKEREEKEPHPRDAAGGAIRAHGLPAGPILAAEILVGFGDVGDAHGSAVVSDFLSRTQGNHAKEHDFGELGGVGERRRGLGVTLRSSAPVEFMGFRVDTRKFWSRLLDGILE